MQRRLITLIAAAMLTAGSATAGEIYRYTDADGNVHYVDRPTGIANEERVAIASRRTNSADVQARIDSRFQNRGAAAEETVEGAEAAKKTRAQLKAEKLERDEKCQSYRAKLETLVTSRRLYREDENGERVYLDESETQEARDKVQELIEENCD